MTPIKLNDFLVKTAPKSAKTTLNLAKLGLYHAAPRENGQPILELKFDAQTGALKPAG